MKKYMLVTAFFYVLVNYLLLKGVAGLFRTTISCTSMIICSVISGVYVLSCLISRNPVLCAVPVYLFTVILIAIISFVIYKGCWVAAFSFVLLYLSLGGVSIRRQAVASLMIGTIGIIVAAFVIGHRTAREYIRVKVRYKDREFALCALLDTGNLLKDPITGKPVLVVAADVAQEMTGLNIQQLKSPVESINILPDSRLIPYKTIGQSGSFLLGVYVPFIKIGNWKGSGVIGLSPEIFGSKGTFQALAGGYV